MAYFIFPIYLQILDDEFVQRLNLPKVLSAISSPRYSMNYSQNTKFLTDRLSILKTEMDDLKMEERLTRNDKIHEQNLRQGRDKKIMVDQVTVT